jgi:hypothetical protein
MTRVSAEPATATATPTARHWRIVAVIAFCAPLIYAGITHHVWEDYLITFRFSENLANGNGLVYNIPERVHGFTSPIGVLLPALLHLLTLRHSYLLTLWLFRIISAAAYAGAVTLLYDAVRISAGKALPAIAIVVLMLLEPKSVSFSANGQETGFMLLWVAAGLRLSLDEPSKRWKWWGIVAVGLQWTRPEGLLYMLALVVANLIFAIEPRRKALIAFVKAGVLGASLYLPWTIFTWVYYGSPIPQTVIAKSVLPNAHATPLGVLRNIPASCAAAFESVYNFGGWPEHIRYVGYGLGMWGLFYWLIPVRDRIGRIASFCFLLLSPYFAYLAVAFAWYYPPFAACALVALCTGLDAIVRRYAPAMRAVAVGILLALIAERAIFMAEFVYSMKTQQFVIEDSNRKQIGLYLHDRVAPNETVMLECLGYIGYFSNAHMLEWPGLVSPQVTKILRQGVTRMDLFDRLKPDWLVLRPREVETVKGDPRFFAQYAFDRTFDVSGLVASYDDMPGIVYIRGDQTFLIFHRKR